MASRSSHPFHVLCAVLAFALAACAGAGADAGDVAGQAASAPAATSPPAPATPQSRVSGTDTAAFPVTVDAGGGSVTVPEQPERVVSLSPTTTEMLFAIGAGEQVVAVDEQSDYPPSAPVTDLSGFQPNIEAIATYEPDLVVISEDATGEGSLAASLGDVGIEVLNVPAATTVEDTYAQLAALGDATGHTDEAESLVADIRAELDRIIASAPDLDDPPAIYHEVDPTLYSATSDTFIGSVYEMFGARNIADAAQDASAYPQLSAEFVIESDPDVIFLADSECCGVTAESLADRPGWDQITAVQEGNVVELDSDVASRWGPRVVEFAEAVSDGLAAAADVTD